MSTSGPDDDAMAEADGMLDALDADVLDRLDALHDLVDGPPPGFTDLMVFAVAAHGLEVELARLEEEVAAPAARAGEEATRSMTFEADSLSILLRVVDAGEDRVRLDGWLAPTVHAVVELRRPDGTHDRVESGDDGRFVLDGVRRGLVQVVVRRESVTAAVVTPTVEL